LGPVFTEKTMNDMEKLNKYFFKVHWDCNKNDVKSSIKTIYNVEPKSVNFVSVVYKWRSNRKLVRKSYKKAIVTLKSWDKIELTK
jgi:ribosomal protein L23